MFDHDGANVALFVVSRHRTRGHATIDPNECLARCRIFIDANLMFATIDDDGPSIHASVQRRIVSI